MSIADKIATLHREHLNKIRAAREAHIRAALALALVIENARRDNVNVEGEF